MNEEYYIAHIYIGGIYIWQYIRPIREHNGGNGKNVEMLRVKLINHSDDDVQRPSKGETMQIE